jgi:steroid 5-alpha reductase family enzyme
MNHLLLTLALAFGMMTALWPLSLKLADVSIIDILWAPAFAVLGWACLLATPAPGARAVIAAGLVSAWALRLGSHILTRWRRLGHEDYRYAAMRNRRGANFPLTSLVTIFWLQALLLWIISLPLQAASSSPAPLDWLDGPGMALATAGIVIEALADRQLTNFRADPANRDRVMDRGLWAWSRHPNYFGDFSLWWGFFLMGIAAGAPWWTVSGPIVMSALLIHFSGAGLMEESITSRRPGYAGYVGRTSLFFPWPPRRRVMQPDGVKS